MKKGPLQREEEKEKTCGVVKGGRGFFCREQLVSY